MSILSVDTIQPIGSGSTVTLNAAKIVVGTGITFESNGQAIYAGIITATSFSGTALNASGATGDFSIADSIVHSGDTNTKIRFPAADTVTVETAGSERLRITSDGKAGIGSVTPTSKLDIYESSGDGVRIRAGDQSADVALSVGSAGTPDKFVIQAGGVLNVPAGIGPQLRFENQHSVTTDAAISTFDDAAGTLLCLGSNFYFNSSGSETRYNTGEESAGIVINRNGMINFNTGGTGATATTRLRINSNGSIQITPEGSTSNPYMLIDTSGDSVRFSAQKASGNNEFRFLTQSSGTVAERLRITSNGNLGLGTSTDDQRLRVYNGIGVNGYKTALFDSNSTHGTRLVITNSNNTSNTGLGIMVGGTYAGTDRASFGWFNSNNTYVSPNLMTIQSDGKIGIGRNDPVNFVDIARGSDEENILIVRGADNTTEYGAMGIHSGNCVITGGGAGSTNTGIMFRTAASGNETNRLLITSAGNVEPVTDDTYDFGSLTKRWANIYTSDLNLSNEGKANDVDGTWGQYTIQEGQDDLYLINKRNGKKYKFLLQEVS